MSKVDRNDKTANSRNRSLGKTILIFFLRFLVASFVLTLLALKFENSYSEFIALSADPLLKIFHYNVIMEKAMDIADDISLNPIVFISLVIATLGVSISKRIIAGLVGFAILTAANIITVFFVFLSYYRGSEALWAGSEFLNLTINFFLPILLWFALLPTDWGRNMK
ncbi:MAG: hypothetical protein B6D63_05270 [Candidatus Latescibacteria bacterium 4484_7]|nr:MAG: hypothetical protein B6D63_05270 [Candidatus Latescibacteria bacterium 4484_7]